MSREKPAKSRSISVRLTALFPEPTVNGGRTNSAEVTDQGAFFAPARSAHACSSGAIGASLSRANRTPLSIGEKSIHSQILFVFDSGNFRLLFAPSFCGFIRSPRQGAVQSKFPSVKRSPSTYHFVFCLLNGMCVQTMRLARYST